MLPSRTRKQAVAGVLAMLLAGCAPKQNDTGAFFEPQFANLIPADTTLLVGASVERLVKTPVYQKYLVGFPLPGVEELAQRTGVNAEKRLWQVMFVSNGHRSFVLGRGKFADELASPDFSAPEANRFGYKGFTLFGDEQRALLMINSSTAAIGDTLLMRALVDQRPGNSGPPVALTAMMKRTPHEAQVWGVWSGGAVDAQLPGNLSNATRVVNSLNHGTMYLDLATNVKGNLSADAVSDKAAEDVYGAFGTLLALAKSGKSAAMYQGVNITKNGRTIQVTLDSPPEVLGVLLR